MVASKAKSAASRAAQLATGLSQTDDPSAALQTLADAAARIIKLGVHGAALHVAVSKLTHSRCGLLSSAAGRREPAGAAACCTGGLSEEAQRALLEAQARALLAELRDDSQAVGQVACQCDFAFTSLTLS